MKKQLGSEASKLVRNSFGEYANDTPGFCKKDIILGQFQSRKEYVSFANGTVKEIARKRKEDKDFNRLLLE